MDIASIETKVLRAFIAEKHGKPEKSHNRPNLEKKALKLGFAPDGAPVEAQPEAMAPAPKAVRAKSPRKAKAPVKAKAKAQPVKRSAPVKAKRAKPATNGEHKFRTHDGPTPVFDVPTKSGEHKTTAPDRTVAKVRTMVENGVSLRGMCAALAAGKFATARGGTSWSPSSVQSIMRAL